MKINFLFSLILAIIFFNGCATTQNMKLTAVASPDQKTGPNGAVVSEKRHIVSMTQYKEIPFIIDNAVFNIIIENGGEEPLTISSENISMTFEERDKKRAVKKLDVLSTREFMQDVDYGYRKKVINDLVQVNLDDNDDIETISMDEENLPVTFNVVFPTRAGSLKLEDLIPPFIDIEEEDELIKELEKMIPNLKKNYQTPRVLRFEENYKKMKTLRETLPDLILSQKTIMPRGSISALICCRTNEITGRIKGDLKITVSIDGEEHEFTFTRK